MKKNIYILVVLCLFSGYAFSQTGGKTIVNDLNSKKAGQGTVKVMQDEAIEKIVAVRQATDTTVLYATGLESTAKNGYRIQAYSGNNQQRSKREAESRQAQVKNVFPELEARVSFHSPFWRLYLGNYVSESEAKKVLEQVKEKFPTIGREMYVVRPGR